MRSRPTKVNVDVPVENDQLRALRLYASYSPSQVVLRYAQQEDPIAPMSAESNAFPAAIGFIDVSGFTALSEKLSREHKRKGAELLNQYINKYFELLISGIAEHGGDVIKFAGDALQVVWRNRGSSLVVGDGPTAEASSACNVPSTHASGPDRVAAAEAAEESVGPLVARAAACCLSLLSSLNEYSPVEGVVLRLHMGVGAGELSEFYVGGHADKWEYFVAGEVRT